MEHPEQNRGFNPRKYRFTLRMRFAYDGKEVKQISDAQRVEMIAPAPTGDAPREGVHSGFWVELRSADERTLYYQVLNSPIRVTVEDYSPDGTLRLVSNKETSGEFELLIPDIPEAQTLVMFNSSQGRRQKLQAAKELGRFDLKGYQRS
ncbi:MAG: hypothetical protein M3437_20965 [Chloroflexota bacterium]|nr:hypothetical protein [Chloroflexota bacterium]MDQ5864939.1 hypothetical protein [Chloroflexota bacterium]